MLFLIETIILCALFFLMCYLGTGSDEKNIKSFASYPDAVKEIVLKNPDLKSKIKKKKANIVFVTNLITFCILLFIFGFMGRAASYQENFIRILLMGEIVNLFDYLVIDMMWFRKSARTRFSVAENPEIYLDMTYHTKSFVKGILLFVLVAAIDGFLLTFI